MSSGFNITGQVNLLLSQGAIRNIASEIQSGLRNVNANIDVQVSPSSAAALGGFNSVLGTTRRNLQSVAADATYGAASLRALTTQTREAADEMERFGHQSRLAGQRFAAFLLAGGGLLQFVNNVKSALGEAIAFERQMVRLSQVGADTQSEIGAIGTEITRLSTNFGVSSRGLASVAVTLKQAGLTANETRVALEAIAKTDLAPTFDGMARTTEGAIAIMSQFRVQASDLERALGSLNSVAGGFSVESADLIEGVRRAGGAFRAAGGDFNEFLALFTSIRSTTRESATSIGTGLRTIFSRLERPQTIEHLRQLGVQLQYTRREAEQLGRSDLEGQFVGPLEAVQRLSQALRGLQSTDARFAAIAEEVGGYREISKVIPLLQEQRKIQEALNVARLGGNSLTYDAAKAQEALAVQASRVKEEFLALARNVFADNGFKTAASDALQLAKALLSVADYLRPLIPLMTTLGTVKLFQSLGSFTTGFLSPPRAGGPPRFHSGGQVGGGGEQLALLEGGEYVLRRQAARAVGYVGLDRLNRYADGGFAQVRAQAGEIGLFNLQEGHRGRVNVTVPLAGTAAFASGSEAQRVALRGFTTAERRAVETRLRAEKDSLKQLNQSELVAYAQREGIGTAGINPYKPGTTFRGQLLDRIFKRHYEDALGHYDKAVKNTNYSGVSVPVDILPVADAYHHRVEDAMASEVKRAIDRSAQGVLRFSHLPGRKVPAPHLDEVYDKVLNQQGKGRFFESIIQAIRGGVGGQSSTATFDLPSPQVQAVQDIFGSPSNIWGDLKVASNTAALRSVAGKAIRQFGLALTEDQKHIQTIGTRELDLEAAGFRGLYKRQLVDVQAKAAGGVIETSGRNIAEMQGFLSRLGIGGINVAHLVRRLLVVNSLRPGMLGAYIKPGQTALARTGTDLPLGEILSHEVLGHAADARAAELFGGTFASTEPGTVQNAIATQARPLIYNRLVHPTVRANYAAQGPGTTLSESLAFGVQAFVRDLLAKRGEVSLSANEARVFDDPRVRRLFGRIGGDLVPEIRSLSRERLPRADANDRLVLSTLSREVGPSLVNNARFGDGGGVDALVMPGEYIFGPDEVRRIGMNRLRQMNDSGRFATGGLVPGHGNTDSVPMSLPVGSFVIKKRSVERLGVENLEDLAQRHRYALGGSVGLAEGDEPGEARRRARRELRREAREAVARMSDEEYDRALEEFKLRGLRALGRGPAGVGPAAQLTYLPTELEIARQTEERRQAAQRTASGGSPIALGGQTVFGLRPAGTPIGGSAYALAHDTAGYGLGGSQPPATFGLFPPGYRPPARFTMQGESPYVFRGGYAIASAFTDDRERVPLAGGVRPDRYRLQGEQSIQQRYEASLPDIFDVADRRTQALVAARQARPRYLGGSSIISDTTREEIFRRQLDTAHQDLLAVTTRQVQALNKGVSATEARRLAEEQLARAAAEGEKVLTDQRGNVLGLAGNVDALQAAGLRPDGRGRLGGFLSDRLGGVPGFGSLVHRLGGRERAVEALQRLGVLGGQIVGSYGAAGLDYLAGSAETAVAGNTTGSYSALKGAGSALSGAVLGGTIGGAVGGPVGVAVGSVAGSLIGLYTALREAEKEIREVKIGNAVTELGVRLTRLANTDVRSLAGEDLTKTVEQIRLIRSQVSERSLAESTSFGRLNLDAFYAANQRGLTQSLGSQLPTIQSVLQRQIEELVRTNHGAGAADIRSLLLQGGSGANHELVQALTASGVPIRTVMDDLLRNIVETQRSFRAQQAADIGRVGEGRNVAAFGRLVSAVEAAANSLDRFQAQTKSLTDLLSGQVAATPVRFNTGSLGDVGTPDAAGYQEALTAIAAATGRPGEQLQQASTAANQVASILPAILSRVISSTGSFAPEDFAHATRRQLEEQLGYGGGQQLPEQLQRAITSVIGQINQMKPEDLVRGAQLDVTKLAEQLLAPLTGPLRDAGVRVGKALEDEANRFIEGVAAARRILSDIGREQDRRPVLALQAARQQALFTAADTGRRHDVLDLLPLSLLESPFRERQERLVGVGGAAASDPAYIANRLRAVRGQVDEATTAQQQAAVSTGGTGPAFATAVQNLARLKDEAARLQEALRHLTDASERSAGAQEKLSKIQQDRESRLSFGERFIRAGADERVTIQRGLLLANQANDHRSLRGFSNEDQRLVLDTLGSLGNARLSGFRGQPNAGDLRENLVREFLGPLGELDQENRRAEQELRQTITENFRQAQAAQQALIEHQSALQSTFFGTLQEQQAAFLSNLQRMLLTVRIAEQTAALGQVGARRNELANLQTQQRLLNRAGITTDAQLLALQNPTNRRLIDAYFSARQQVTDVMNGFALTRDQELAAVNARGGVTTRDASSLAFVASSSRLAPGNRRLFQDTLAQSGVRGTEQDFATLYRDFVALARQELETAGIEPNSVAGLSRSGGPDWSRAQEILRRSLHSVLLHQSVTAGDRYERDIVRPALQQANNAVPGLRLQDVQDSRSLYAAADAFQSRGLNFSMLAQQTQSLSQEFASLTASVQQLRASLPQQPGARPGGGNAFGLASGGSVPASPAGLAFRPHGTDTVPAMLTPGEFVVNARAARANQALLQQMNYMADGGPVGGPPPLADPAREAARLRDRDLFLAAYHDANPAERRRMWAEFTRHMGTENIFAVSQRFSDGDEFGQLPVNWQGYIMAFLQVYREGIQEQVNSATQQAAAIRQSIFTPRQRPGVYTPAESNRREEAEYRRYLQFLSENLSSVQLQTLVNTETADTISLGRGDLGRLEPEQRGRLRALREMQAWYIQSQTEAAAGINFNLPGGTEAAGYNLNGRARVRARRPEQVARTYGSVGQELLIDNAAYGLRQQFADTFPTFEDRERFFANNANYATPAAMAARAAAGNRSVEQSAYDLVFMQQYGLHQAEVERRRQRDERTRQSVASGVSVVAQAATQTLVGNQVNRTLRGQAAVNPGGAAGLLVSQNRAATYYGQQLAGLAAQQSLLNTPQPGAAFGRVRPGLEAQLAIAAGAYGRLVDQNRQVAITTPSLQSIRTLRAGGPQHLPFDPSLPPPLRFAAGGLVPGISGGQVDDVPAFLSRGEFVLNRRATQSIGRDVLESVNRGGPPAQNGQVGGLASAMSGFSAAGNALGVALNSFVANSTNIAATFNQFVARSEALATAMNQFPRSLTVQNSGRVDVVLNGAEVLARLTDGVREFVVEQIEGAIRRAFRERLPDA